jgi:hypothetical protein
MDEAGYRRATVTAAMGVDPLEAGVGGVGVGKDEKKSRRKELRATRRSKEGLDP